MMILIRLILGSGRYIGAWDNIGYYYSSGKKKNHLHTFNYYYIKQKKHYFVFAIKLAIGYWLTLSKAFE